MKYSESDKNKLILVSYKGEMPSRLLITLKHKGFSIHLAGDLKEAEQIIIKTPSVLMVYSEDAAVSGDLVLALSNLKTRGNSPLILLGKEVGEHETALNKAFLTATTLNLPCSDADLLEAAIYSVDALKKASAKEKPSQETTESAPSTKVPLVKSAKDKDDYNSIPESLFKNFAELDLVGKSIGGSEYLKINFQSFKKDLNNFPSNRDAQVKIEQLFALCADHEKSDLARTSFIGRKMTQVLQVDEKFDDDVKSASLLYPIAFFPSNKALYKKEYLDENSNYTRNEIGKFIQKSASEMAKDFLSGPSDIVSSMSQLMTFSAKAQDDEVSMIASSLLISDLTNRVCFQTGVWDSRRAYYLLKKFKTNNPYNFHPKVVCCAIKFLSEAILAKPLACLLPYAVRNDPELIDAAYQTQHREVRTSEAKVPLTCLAPGMRLSKPLFAFDGRLVLSEGLIFDEDLIYRIWQLSALRPLNNPVVIFVNP